MKYCCEAFKHAFNKKQGRGFSVFSAEDYSNNPIFYLYYKVISSDSEQKVVEFLSKEKPDVSLSLASETVIIYCPWCGKNLLRFYKKTWKEILGTPISSIL